MDKNKDESWEPIKLYADNTWTPKNPDTYILANKKLWMQYCTNKVKYQNIATAEKNGITVRDVIPESRLSQFYGKFSYDSEREKLYIIDYNDMFYERIEKLVNTNVENLALHMGIEFSETSL